MDVSVVIVSYNTKEILLACLKSVFRYTKVADLEVIVIDNNSTDGSVEALKKNYSNKIKVVENKENLGFGKANNQGIKASRGKYILLLNSDTELTEDSLSKMVNWMEERSSVGVATCKLKNTDESTQATGGYFPNLIRVFLWATFLDDLPVVNRFGSYHPHTGGIFGDYYKSERELDWVTGAFFLIRRSLIEKVGVLDENFFMYVEELEYCYRIKKAGWKIFYTPITQIIHIGGASGIRQNSILGEFKNLRLFYSKHKSVLEVVLLEIFLKVAAILRIVAFSLLGKKDVVSIYAKALV